MAEPSDEASLVSDGMEAEAGWIAVGIPLGTLFNADDPEAPEAAGVRLAGQIVFLSLDAYRMWLGALGAPSHEELLRSVEGLIAGSGEIIEELAATGLLEPYGGNEPAREVLRRLRAFPVGVGLGNTLDRPDRYQIGDQLLDAVIEADPVPYLLWCQLDGLQTVYECCERVAGEHGLDVALVAEIAWALVPQLMASRLLIVDCVSDPVEATASE